MRRQLVLRDPQDLQKLVAVRVRNDHGLVPFAGEELLDPIQKTYDSRHG